MKKIKEWSKKMEKDLMSNFSISIYRRTKERYLEFKNKNELTHDEAINKLIDIYEHKKKGESDAIKRN